MYTKISYLCKGGGWKVNLLKEELNKRARDDKGQADEGQDDLIMFTDSYDVIIAAGIDSIIGKNKIL